MRYYVDFENVRSAGMKGVERLSENDTVIIFYSEEFCRITFEMLRNVLEAKAKLEFIEIKITYPNSLDFQLSTKLGYDVAKFPDEKFAIISGDKGFKPVVSFWQKNSADVSLCPDIKTADYYISRHETIPDMYPMPENNQNDQTPVSEEDISFISDMLRKCRTKDLVHKTLMKEYGGAKATALYHAVKNLINKKTSQTHDAIVNAVNSGMAQMASASEEALPISEAETNTPAEEAAVIPAEEAAAQTEAPAEEAPAENAAPAKKPRGKAAAKNAAEEAPPEKKKAGRPKKVKPPTLSELIPQYQSDVKRVEEIIGKYKTKLGISKALVREYDEMKAEAIYSLITPLISDKKGRDTGADR